MTSNDHDELTYWAALHALPGMGPITFRRLVDRFGSAAATVEESTPDALSEVKGMTSELAVALAGCRAALPAVERQVQTLTGRGVKLLRLGDAAYPARLLELSNPPPLLYVYGEIIEADLQSVSMVGTTHPSDRGRAIAERIASRFAAAGVTVVSGFAHGIDAASHRGAFNGGGRSILCLPCGIRHFHPRPDFPPVAEIARRGAIVSECPPEAEWSAQAAVARNRLIAALGSATFVVETRPKGGTHHTVRAAKQLGRPLFALKYQKAPESARGNSILIAQGAEGIVSFSDADRIIAAVKPS